MDFKARRWITALGVLALGGLALAVFVLPFAFPTPPPIITRFQATQIFSPSDDGRRDVARVSIRVREASTLSLDVRQGGNTVARLVTDEEVAPGWLRVPWDGRSDDGEQLPDGAYAFKLQARSGKKRFNASRRVEIDTAPPGFQQFEVVSAALAGPGPGQCRTTVVADEDVSVTIEAVPPDGGGPVAAIGPRPVAGETASAWAWNGRANGELAEPGLYTLNARLQDPPGNRAMARRTCWVGNMIGTPRGGGDTRGVRLLGPDGTPLAAGTPVTLSVHQRVGTPGGRSGPVIGARLSGPVTGAAGSVRIRLPNEPLSDLWLVASAREARALIPLTPERTP